jgi:hypothetical protein
MLPTTLSSNSANTVNRTAGAPTRTVSGSGVSRTVLTAP